MSYDKTKVIPSNILEDFLKTVPHDKEPIRGLLKEDTALQTYAHKLTRYGEYDVNYRNEPWGTHKEFFEVLDGNGYMVNIEHIGTFYKISIERQPTENV